MKFHLKDPVSSLTHFAGMLLTLIAAPFLLVRAADNPDHIHLISMIVFLVSMVLLYGASATYHAFDLSVRTNRVLRKMDHIMIFILIAGTYTPICLIPLSGRTGMILLAVIWGLAVLGILIKAFWITCPKWFSSVIYIAMGWVCLFSFPQLIPALGASFWWLLAGGILYTVGGVLYALKLSIFNKKHKYFGSHEIFHLFVMAGSFCHFMLMVLSLARMPL